MIGTPSVTNTSPTIYTGTTDSASNSTDSLVTAYIAIGIVIPLLLAIIVIIVILVLMKLVLDAIIIIYKL